MGEEREREVKLNFPEAASCFSPLMFPSVRNSAVYKRGIILQTFCRVLDLCLQICVLLRPHKWVRIGTFRTGIPLSVVQLLSNWSTEGSMATLSSCVCQCCSSVTGKMIIFPISNRDDFSTSF